MNNEESTEEQKVIRMCSTCKGTGLLPYNDHSGFGQCSVCNGSGETDLPPCSCPVCRGEAGAYLIRA